MKSCLIPQISLTLVALITMLLLALVACGGGGPEELEIPVKSAPGRLWAPLGAVKAIRPAAAKVAASSHPRSGDAGGADQGAAAWRDGGVTPGTALVALRTGLDGFLALPPQAGAETRCTTGPTSRRLLHPGPCGFGPAVPGAPARAGDPQVRWLLPVQVPGTPSAASEALRSCCALTPGVVSGPPQGSWKSGRKAIGRVSR